MVMMVMLLVMVLFVMMMMLFLSILALFLAQGLELIFILVSGVSHDVVQIGVGIEASGFFTFGGVVLLRCN